MRGFVRAAMQLWPRNAFPRAPSALEKIKIIDIKLLFLIFVEIFAGQCPRKLNSTMPLPTQS